MLFQPFYKRKIGSSIKKSEVYFELLKKAQEQGKQVQKSMHKWVQLEKEYESAIENYKKAKSGQFIFSVYFGRRIVKPRFIKTFNTY